MIGNLTINEIGGFEHMLSCENVRFFNFTDWFSANVKNFEYKPVRFLSEGIIKKMRSGQKFYIVYLYDQCFKAMPIIEEVNLVGKKGVNQIGDIVFMESQKSQKKLMSL